MKDVQRVKTGIKEFDKLINGGIPKGSSVLISGSPGTGKTIFGLQFLYNGANFGEPGIYLTLEENKEKLVNQAFQFGWDIEKLEKKNLLVIKYVETIDLETLIEDLRAEVKKIKAQRLVVDSLPMLTVFTGVYSQATREIYGKDAFKICSSDSRLPPRGEEISRREISYVINCISSLNLTSLLISEVAEGSEWLSRDTISEFLADGIIMMNYMGLGGEEYRTIMVRKMRWTPQERGYIPFEIDKTGIVLKPDEAASVMLK